MDRFILLTFLALHAICCHGQDFATFPTNPPALNAPTASPAPTSAAPTPTTSSSEPPVSTPTAPTPQPVADRDAPPSKTSVNVSSFILLFGGIAVAVVLFLVTRSLRRRDAATEENTIDLEAPQNPIEETTHQQLKCQRHYSHDSHSSARTATSSVDSMVYLDAYEWRSTTRQIQNQAGRNPSASISPPHPKPQAPSMPHAPIRSSRDPDHSNTAWLNDDDDNVSVYDEISSTRTNGRIPF